MKIRIYIFIWCLFCMGNLAARSLFRIEYINMTGGLPQDNITGIVQDQRGLLWFSTFNGLCSYNGYAFKNYKYTPGQEHTLHNNRIVRMAEGMEGCIWCQTFDGKVYRFDPRTEMFYNVPIQTSEDADNKEQIYVLPKGVVWITTRGGMCYRINESCFGKPGSMDSYSATQNSLKGSYVHTIFQDSEGDEWILTNRGVVVVGNAAKQLTEEREFVRILELEGNLYLATRTNELLRYDLGSRKSIIVKLPDGVSNINHMVVTHKKQIALATDGGVILYDTTNGRLQTFSISLPGHRTENAGRLYEDRTGGLWVFTSLPGVVHLDPKTGGKQHLTTSRQETDPDFQNRMGIIFEDNNGTLWVRPNHNTFAYYDRKEGALHTVENLQTPGIPLGSPIRFFFQDRQDNTWLVSKRGVYKLSPSSAGYDMTYLDNDLEQRCFFRDNRRRLWVASKKACVRIFHPDGTLQGYLSPQGRIVEQETLFENVYSMCMDEEGDIWLGTRHNGLYRLSETENNNYRVRHYSHNPQQASSLSNDEIFSIYCDTRGRLWVGTYSGGLNLVQKDAEDRISFIHSNNRLTGYPANEFYRVRFITETDDGVLLLGTTAGLVSFSGGLWEPEEFVFYTNRQQNDKPTRLTGNDVMHIYQASDKSIYVLTSSGGINKIVSDNLLSNDIAFQCYNQANGLGSDMVYSMIEDAQHKLWVVTEYALSRFDPIMQTFENYELNNIGANQYFSEAKPLRCRGGSLLFGTNLGILEVNPTVMRNSFTPPILFVGLQAGNRKIIPTGKEYIELQPQERNLRVRYAALDYSNPEDILYAYRLEGLDEEWIYAGRSKSATYQNLPPGEYTLQVKSTNSDGVWRDNMAMLEIHVLPTFWETPWAVLVYLLLFALSAACITSIVLYIYRLRHRVGIEKHLADVKLRFFTDISHELRTPLTLIAGPVSEVLEEESLSPEARRHLNMVQTNTDRMLELVNQILDFRKIQNNKMKLLVSQTDLTALLETVIEKFRFMAEENRISLNYHSGVTQPVWVDGGKVEMMFSNLLSNAFKYTHPGKAIVVNLRQTANDCICISVTDEGVGIAPDKLESIFHRFETVAGGSTSQPSSGIGLSLVKRLVELHHGNIRVNSRLGVGSEFIISLPIGKAVYEQDANAEFVLADGCEMSVDKLAGAETEATDNERNIILVVEDNTELRTMLRNILCKHYRILEADDGRKGLQLAMEHIPDMIISDVMMPVMDGLEMVRHIKGHRELNHALIVLLTAKAAMDDRITALEQQVDDYITKPFNSTYLKVRITALFERRRQQQELMMERLAGTDLLESKSETEIRYNPEPPDILPHDEQFIEEVMSYLEEQIDNPDLSVEDMAGHLNLGRKVFSRKLKSIVGITPTAFMQEIRVKRAAQLLLTQNYTVSQVAYMTGFNDPRYFNRCFKKHFGMTASDYQKEKSRE